MSENCVIISFCLFSLVLVAFCVLKVYILCPTFFLRSLCMYLLYQPMFVLDFFLEFYEIPWYVDYTFLLFSLCKLKVAPDSWIHRRSDYFKYIPSFWSLFSGLCCYGENSYSTSIPLDHCVTASIFISCFCVLMMSSLRLQYCNC